MPLYEYECEKCGNRFEKIQKFSDPLETACPKCAGPVHKLVSSPAIQFKGSGFYITDYPKGDKGTAPKSDGGKSDKAAKAGKVDSPASSSTETKSEKSSGSTDSAPASSSTASTTSTSSTAAASTPSTSKE